MAQVGRRQPFPALGAHRDLRGNVPNFLDPDWWREIGDWLVAKDISFLVVDSLRAISAVLATNEPA